MTSGICRLNILLDLGSWQGVWARLWWGQKERKGSHLCLPRLSSSPSAKPSQMGAGEAEGRMPLEQISLVLIIQVSGELGPEPQWRGPQLRACFLGVCVRVTSG